MNVGWGPSWGIRYRDGVPYPFLSDEWVVEIRRIRAGHPTAGASSPVSIRMNQVITDVPFGEGVVKAHIDTSSGTFEIELGHLEAPDLTITLAYDVAKAVLIDGDPQAAMAAFLGGRIKVDGDITKLLALQATELGSAVDPAIGEIYAEIKAATT
jgi:hypothetical protein